MHLYTNINTTRKNALAHWMTETSKLHPILIVVCGSVQCHNNWVHRIVVRTWFTKPENCAVNKMKKISFFNASRNLNSPDFHLEPLLSCSISEWKNDSSNTNSNPSKPNCDSLFDASAGELQFRGRKKLYIFRFRQCVAYVDIRLLEHIYEMEWIGWKSVW